MVKRDAIILACSFAKRAESGPAIWVYDGLFYRVMRKHRPNCGLYVLSAKYGLIDAAEEIEPYDQKMDWKRAMELRQTVEQQYISKIDDKYRFVTAIMNDMYWATLAQIAQYRRLLWLKATPPTPGLTTQLIMASAMASQYNKMENAPKPEWVNALEKANDTKKHTSNSRAGGDR